MMLRSVVLNLHKTVLLALKEGTQLEINENCLAGILLVFVVSP